MFSCWFLQIFSNFDFHYALFSRSRVNDLLNTLRDMDMNTNTNNTSSSSQQQHNNNTKSTKPDRNTVQVWKNQLELNIFSITKKWVVGLYEINEIWAINWLWNFFLKADTKVWVLYHNLAKFSHCFFLFLIILRMHLTSWCHQNVFIAEKLWLGK